MENCDFSLKMDEVLKKGILDDQIRYAFNGVDLYVVARDICELFADVNPEITINAVDPQFTEIVKVDGKFEVGLDVKGVDLALLRINPDTQKATPQQLENISVLREFAEGFRKHIKEAILKENDGILTKETLDWCQEHPEEAKKAMKQIFVDNNFDVPEVLQPFVKLYLLECETNGVQH